MKPQLAAALNSLMMLDERVVVLTGDLGYGLFDDFPPRFGRRFINCGIAEQSMIGVAAGLALEGMKPVVYSIANFVTLRCAEQIRNDLVIPGLDVMLVAAGGGFTYGSAGYSHHATEDLALIRSLRGIRIFTPSFSADLPGMFTTWTKLGGPAYLRLDREVVAPTLSEPSYVPGAWRIMRQGETAGLFSLGSCRSLAYEASEMLAASQISTRLVDCNQLSGLESSAILETMSGLRVIATLEEHSTIGGLGSLVAEFVTEAGLGTTVVRFGISGSHALSAGRPNFQRELVGLTPANVVSVLSRPLAEAPNC